MNTFSSPSARSELACPDCGRPIPFDPQALLAGLAFTCGHCGSRLSLARESRAVLSSALGELTRLRGGEPPKS